MHFVSLEFVAFVAVSLLLFHLAGRLAARRAVFFAINLAFVAGLASTPSRMTVTAVFLIAGYLAVRAIQAGRQRWAIWTSILAAVAAFVYLKRYSVVAFLPPLDFSYSTIGLSYLLFRILHLLVDCYEGALTAPIPFVSFFNYCCSFLSWLSGPIQRYEEYIQQEQGFADLQLAPADVHDALSRIVTGVFKVAVVSAVLLALHQECSAIRLTTHAPVRFTAILGAAASLYSLYMYYNFAGYMDVVIGLGVFFGFRLPENFNRPFASRNFLEFWSRWHITLSNWFKFYVFNASVRALTSRWGSARSTPYLGVAAYFVTFALMGVWHGSTTVFLLYGLFLGGGVSANKLYEIQARKRLGRQAFQRLRANRIYARACQGAVFAYFSAALLCFWATPLHARRILEQPQLAVAAFVLVTVLAALSFALGAALRTFVAHLIRSTEPTLRRRSAAQLVLAAKTYAVLVLIQLQATAIPDFVYVPF
jgi:D-alanyl-lipoteichoic acid acyltransferase DltB (MBOAT superfamily)